jgi:hypothetical protein
MATKRIATFIKRNKNPTTARHWVTLNLNDATRVANIADKRSVSVGEILKTAVLDWLTRQERT